MDKLARPLRATAGRLAPASTPNQRWPSPVTPAAATLGDLAPGDKATCLQRAGGELNTDFMQCRSGRRELVRTNYDGTRTVLEVRPLN